MYAFLKTIINQAMSGFFTGNLLKMHRQLTQNVELDYMYTQEHALTISVI